MKRPKGVRKGSLLIVDWLDAEADYGWETHKDARAPLVRSVGIVVAANGTAFKLAADYDPKERGNADVNRSMVIPWGMVQAVRSVDVRDCRRLA